MSPTIIVALVLMAVGFIAAVFVAVRNQMATMYQGAKILLDVDIKTGNLVSLPLNKRKPEVAYGSGTLVYPTGVLAQPQTLAAGWRAIDYPNVRLIAGRDFILHLFGDIRKENDAKESTILDLQNTIAKLQAENRQLRRPLYENMLEFSKTGEKMKTTFGTTIMAKQSGGSRLPGPFPPGGGA